MNKYLIIVVFLLSNSNSSASPIKFPLMNSNLTSSNQTQTCPYACDKCLNSTYCSICSQGFYWDTNLNLCLSCNSLIPHCELCSDSKTCLKCEYGHSLFINSQMCIFDENFKNCDMVSDDYKQCKKCNLGYYLGADNISCIQCNNPICAECDSEGKKCKSCLFGSNLINSDCVDCNENFCKTCPNPGICNECINTFYLGKYNTCLSCKLNCLECSDEFNCLKCMKPYYLDGNNCLQCNDKCETCFDKNSCNGCKKNYQISNGTCESCANIPSISDNCLTCNDNVCTRCDIGYPSGIKCISCSDSNCDICSGPNICNKCHKKFYVSQNNSQSICASCIENCDFCVNDKTCNQCRTGYFVDSNNTCTTCQNNCLGCSNATMCNSCINGYYLTSNNTCSACIENCEECSDGSFCNKCSSGYAYNFEKNICVKCPENCLICSPDGTVCAKCIPDRYLHFGYGCQKCDSWFENCEVCSLSQNCIKCKTNFTNSIFKGLCRCSDGFYRVNSTNCAACDESCETCIRNSKYCLTCSDSALKPNENGVCSSSFLGGLFIIISIILLIII